jgi:cytochrome P450
MRKACVDLSVAGVPIRKGEIVLPLVASANHDEAYYNNPHAFDINRSNKAHLAFGSGIHYCLGTHLAKLQSTIALKTLFQQFASVTLTQDSLHYLPSFFFRSLCKLPVILHHS